MTGPEHYEAAEACLDRADETKPGRLSRDLYLAAQVHATLALAAATATLIPERDPQGNDNSKQLNDWAGAGAL